MTGKYRNTPTLPKSSILRPAERDEIARCVSELTALCGPTPADDVGAAQETLIVVTKMMLVLPAAKQNDVSAEARGEAYMAALDDLPTWAVAAAVRRWYRGECGKNSQGEPYDYHWPPSPADLRAVSLIELWRVKARAEMASRLLTAEPLIEYSDEHRRDMRRKLANLFRNFGTPLVGQDGSGGAVGERRSMAPTVGPDQSAPRP